MVRAKLRRARHAARRTIAEHMLLMVFQKKGLSYTKNDVRQPPVTSVRRLKSIYRSAVEVMLDYKE